MKNQAISLTQYLLSHEAKNAELGPDFCHVMGQLAFAAKSIAREVSRAALVEGLGSAGEQNASGDVQKKLDVSANEAVIGAFVGTGLIAEIISEEMVAVRRMPGGADAQFILCIDPLDGSSNTEADGALGTIFALHRRRKNSPGDDAAHVDFCGSEQVAAGYVLYGPSTVLVYTSSAGVIGFTLDPELGEFLLSHADIRCPSRGNYFGANLGNLHQWYPGTRKYVEHLTSDKVSERTYSLRYTGAFVADFHRILLSGGIFFYPGDPKHPAGKLRLLYECAPMALLIEHAGGRASDGKRRILEIEARELHQRTAIAIGSADEVAVYEKFFKQDTL
jgi:fructose-1,6-bisphosphatase I